jgi:DNA topoisomerase-1
MIQIGASDEEEKPRYARLRAGQRLETITFEEALDLFKLPRLLGELEEQPVKVGLGRFGPYVQLGKDFFVSLEEGDDPYGIELDRAAELIARKRAADAARILLNISPEAQVLNGRWGPYLKYKGENVKLPKDLNYQTLTLEDCERLFQESQQKPKRKAPPRGRKK